jgi:RNA polymerase sigma-70 factor, ECF subfamily
VKPGTLRTRRFESIVGEVYEPLQRYLLRRAHRDVVDDLLAESLLVVWRRLDEVPTSNALPWCYGVAANVLRNQRRSENRHLRLVERAISEPAGAESTDDEVDDGALLQAIAELSDDEQELVRLWAWEQLEPREIAVALATTPNAISLRLGRAKKKISVSLERQNREVSGQRTDVNPESHVGEM